MIRTLRALFLARLLREKLLVMAFAALGLAWWLSAFGTRLNAFNTQRRRTTAALNEQQQWLDHRKAIEVDAQKAAAKLDRAKTLDRSALLAAIGNMAREAGLKQANSGTPTNQSNGQFSVHSLDYTINNAEWGAVKKFFNLIQERSPYISIENFQLRSLNPAGTQYSLTLKVSSVEVSL